MNKSVKISLKDIYKSVQTGKKIKRIKEQDKKKQEKNREKIFEDLITEDVVTRFLDKFFNKVAKNQADDTIKNLKKTNPEAASALEKIKEKSIEIQKLFKTDVIPDLTQREINDLFGIK